MLTFFKNISLEKTSWRSRMIVVFALTSIIPLLTLAHFVLAYVIPNAVTSENIIIIGFCNLVIAIGGFFILRNMIMAQTNIKAYLERLATGDLENQLITKNGPDSDSIAKSTNAIVGRIRNAHTQLEKLANTRTSELAQANKRLQNELAERANMEKALRESNMRLSDALRDLQYMQRELIQQERVSALGQMASGIAHDFNNALMPIVGLSELLLDQSDMLNDKKELRVILNDIHSAAVDARDIVRRLKEFYRKDAEPDFAPVDLNEIVEKTMLLTKPRWQEEMKARGTLVTISNKLDKIPLINGHASQLRELFTNLILNSIDAMPNGGNILVKFSIETNSLVVEVIDTGEGMTSEVRKHCLNPLFSTKGTYGSGIGLTVADNIVKKHGGSIDVLSEPGQGTTVRLRFPLLLIKTPAGQPTGDSSQQDLLHPLRILVIEDDSRSSSLLEKYLSANNHVAVTQAAGKDGIACFKSDHFDVVLTDRALPDMSGDSVAQSIKEINPDTPIIMLTGFGELMKDKGEIPDCIDILLSKPVTFDELHAAIREVATRLKKETKQP
ncbi:MAG: response regulator [Lentisphaerae bacterium]|nr:response regulator [Lentisphaerota bacterium]